MNRRDPFGERLDCDRVRDLAALVPGADLPSGLDEPVRAHLADCVDCRRELGRFLNARHALQSLQPERQPAHAEFFADLKADTLAAVRSPTRRRPVSVSGLLTAAALFLIGVYFVSGYLPQPWERMAPIDHPTPVRPERPTRIQEVGWYGLLGRHRLHSSEEMAELTDAVPAPVRGAAAVDRASSRPLVRPVRHK